MQSPAQTRYSHFPGGLSDNPPSWVEPLGHGEFVNGCAVMRYRITPPRGLQNLAITFIYEDSSRFGHFIRAIWEGRGGSVLLSNNIREGSGFHNTRTLLIESSELTGPGILVIQSSTARLGVTSLHFSWVTPTKIMIPADATPEAQIITESGRSVGLEEISGDVIRPPLESYLENLTHGDVLTAPVVEAPMVHSGPVTAFEVNLAGDMPALARLSLDINGLDTTSDVEIFLNGQSIGALAVDAPDLREPGYQWTIGGNPQKRARVTYLGWRKGTFLIPEGLLRPGKNYIHFRAVDATAPLYPRTIAIRKFEIQLKYRPLSAAPPPDGVRPQRRAPQPISQHSVQPFASSEEYSDDTLDPLPRADPLPEIEGILTPRPLGPGAAQETPPFQTSPILFNTGQIPAPHELKHADRKHV